MPKHPHSCKNCKLRIGAVLAEIYGNVSVNHNLHVPSKLEEYRRFKFYDDLAAIHLKLQSHRGFENFVKQKKLSAFDFYVHEPGFAVEFDEVQHFTEPRRLALDSYPQALELGFDRRRWIALCTSYQRKDHDPPYRDEQRAWYDTLRDFSASYLGILPTVRLFPEDVIWCEVQGNSQNEVWRLLNSCCEVQSTSNE
jgi:hypothetical protein